jgi:hypothetical protein
MEAMSQYCPPPVLVKTWLMLINSRSSDSDEARAHAKRMIDVNFGSVDLAIIYLEQSQSDNTPMKVDM